MDFKDIRLLIVGNHGGTSIGDSFARSAKALDTHLSFVDASDGQHSVRIINSILWRFGDKRPAKLHAFGRRLLQTASNDRTNVLLTTGLVPVSTATLVALKAKDVTLLHYSTDDPWNPALRANWFLNSLPGYDFVFTTRQRNINDLWKLGCKNVRYLPFAYDDSIFRLEDSESVGAGEDLLFVGGADQDRVDFVGALLAQNIPITLVGGNWNRYPAIISYSLGIKSPEQLVQLTRAAKINLCLVRRANRDGHVMRSFEIAALGGCMVVEDTAEHREMFGADGECVVYFGSPVEAAEKIRRLLVNTDECRRLGRAVQARVVGEANTYTDRLASMLATANELRYAKERSR